MSVQSIPSTQTSDGQVGSMAQAPRPSQSVSQRHDREQSMPPVHEAVPLHSTSQRPAPQVTSPPQAPVSLHSMLQAVAPLQSTPPWQALVPAQCTSHGMPAGQTTPVWQAPLPSQEMTQVPRWQRSHADGQPPASARPPLDPSVSAAPPSPGSAVTHQPSTQARPSLQSPAT